MVLDNAAGAQEQPFPESLPSSDIDPYANSDSINPATRSVICVTPPGTTPPVHVNLDNLPRRWSLFTTKPHHPMLPKGITESCRYAQEALGRPVRQEDADAFAYHYARSVRIASYGSPIGLTLATIMSARGQTTYRFPGGFSPLNHHRFSVDSLGPLKNQAARTAWQMLRIAAYWGIGGPLGSVFFAVYGISTSLAGRALDPRLKEFTEAMKRRQENRQGALPGGRQVDQSDGPRKDETMEMARQRRGAQGAWGRRREQQSGQSGGEDDMSPTGGAFQEEFVQSGSDTGLMDDNQSRQREYSQRADARTSPAENTANTYDYSRMRTQTRSSDQQRETSPSTSDTPSSGGSAWDRIRQGAMSGASSSSRYSGRSQSQGQQQSRGNADSGDSFTFSQGEEDNQLARSEAQKEFDARIERERAGQDFEDQGSRGRRW